MLLAPSLRSHSFGVVLDVPRYNRWLDEQDLIEPYEEYRVALGYLSRHRDTALVMKGPSHTPCVDALHRAVPEARIIYLHRDPLKTVSSYCSLSAVHHRTFYGHFDPDTVGAKILGRFARFTELASARRGAIPADRILDVYYHDLVADPVATVRRIGEHFGDAWSDEADSAVRAQLAALPQHKKGRHHYSAEQWGLSARSIRERFAAYLREHDVRLED